MWQRRAPLGETDSAAAAAAAAATAAAATACLPAAVRDAAAEDFDSALQHLFPSADMDRIFWLTRPLHAGGCGCGDGSDPLHLARRLLSEGGELSSGQTAVYIIISVLLVIFSGMMAGLTLGLLSLGEPAARQADCYALCI